MPGSPGAALPVSQDRLSEIFPTEEFSEKPFISMRNEECKCLLILCWKSTPKVSPVSAASCGLVLAWQNWLPDKVVRRLQLAAETGETLGVLFQHRMSKHLHSSLRLEIKNFSENSPIGKAPGRNFYGALRENVYGDSIKHSERSAQTQITVLKARGNFRPLSVQLNLYQDSLPFQPATRPEGNREQP